MKSDGIQRSVRTHRHDRAAGDAPSIGRVARVPGTGLPKGVRRKKLRSEGGRGNKLRQSRKTIVTIWSILLCGVVLATLGFALGSWLIPKMRPAAQTVGQLQAEEVASARVESKFPSPPEETALALVKQGLAVRDPAKIPTYFRRGTATPEEIVDFLKTLEATEGRATEWEWLGSMDANGMSIDGVVVSYKGDEKPRNRIAFLTPDAEGDWKIDFNAFARTVSPPWPDYLEGSLEYALVRVYVARDSYYNGPFSDDKQWVCYGIASPDMDRVLLAYAKTGTPQAAAMQWLVSKDSKLSRATLEIRRVDAAQSRQYEISRVLAQDWVVAAAPFDEGFK